MPRYTADWFTEKTGPWLEHVVPRFRGRPNTRWLEVGVYEGLSVLWILDNILTGGGSLIVCVDFFDPAPAWAKLWGNVDYVKLFDENTADRPNVIRLKGASNDVLPILGKEKFHGVYLDAGHKRDILTRDLELIWPLIEGDGLLICDDYRCDKQPEAGPAIDAFLSRDDVRHEVLFKDFQIIVRKRS
jgi:predicted O-methyltransferase YrrM